MTFRLRLLAGLGSARQRVQDAASELAERCGDVAADEYLHAFYRTEAAKVDPKVDWWGYAELREKQKELEQDLVVSTRRRDEARAYLEAQRAKMENRE